MIEPRAKDKSEIDERVAALYGAGAAELGQMSLI